MARRWIAIADFVNVALALALALFALLRLARAPGAAGAVVWLAPPLGFATADVASGLVHWFCDTQFSPLTPLLGPMIIAPFRQHHDDPSAICRHGALERNGNNCLAALPLLGFANVGVFELRERASVLCMAWLVFTALTLCVTNQIHAWAHASDRPRWVRALQRSGILLRPERHALHHRGGHARAYAVVSGWSNPWLDRVLATFAARRRAARRRTS